MLSFQLPDFTDPGLLQKAMTHKSHANELGHKLLSNERLEFLGDAILNFLCGQFLYERYPEKMEGELTELRSSLVDKKQLSEFAICLQLNRKLRLGKGVENSGGRDNLRLLSSAFEALIGAYFLDRDRDIEPVRQYVYPFFQWALRQRGEMETIRNYKSQLQAWALAEMSEIPEYALIGTSGPDHDKRFIAEVRIQGQRYGKGIGNRKQDAEKQAARSALERLGQL
jgi:ribonuclease-3